VDVETIPPQPDEVARAIAAELPGPEPEPDPWWQAGLDETLGE
jgi:hypothetical protein